MITNTVINYIYDTHGHRITEWKDMLLDPVMLEEHANVRNIKGSPLENCFGFIDGTVRPICRPGIQWPQKSECTQIPECSSSFRDHSKHVWTSG